MESRIEGISKTQELELVNIFTKSAKTASENRLKK